MAKRKDAPDPRATFENRARYGRGLNRPKLGPVFPATPYPSYDPRADEVLLLSLTEAKADTPSARRMAEIRKRKGVS